MDAKPKTGQSFLNYFTFSTTGSLAGRFEAEMDWRKLAAGGLFLLKTLDFDLFFF